MKRVTRKLVLGILLLVLVVVAGAMAWQQVRYLDTRRNVVMDRQPLLYGSDIFHVVTFLRTRAETDVIDEVRSLYDASEGLEGAAWVYAGKAAMTSVSSQIGPVEWSAVAIVQYPTRAAYDCAAASDAYRAALSGFDAAYSQGLVRPAALNLLLHQLLLGERARQIVVGQPSFFPLTRMEGVDGDPRSQQGVGRLLAERELGAEAVVVVNVSRTGTVEQQASDESYGRKMLAAMAEGGYGPMHFGSAVRVERDYDFDRIAVVYYPGVEFFADLIRSEFFRGIIGDKSLGDHQAVITVPILDRL